MQSKRKTPTYITFYRGERMFGADSYALMTRKPDLTFAKLFRMIGKAPNHPHLEELAAHYFPFEFFANETDRVTSLKQEDTYYTPEELLAMMMQHARDITKNYAEKDIRDCVLTVPASFSQHERMALYTAAAIADFNVLSLIEENTAAALNFGMDRNFDEPTTVLFYNMGASSVEVSIVTFSSTVVKEGGKNKTVSQFDVVGKAWDTHLGGFSFDIQLAELLADRFNEAWVKKASKNGKVEVDKKDYDVRKFARPMARLRLEALKLKEILSGNSEFPIKIEQLHADVNLVTKVSRAEFEAHCEGLFNRVTDVVTKALDMADLTLQNVSAVELLGGGVRVPKVKQMLEAYFRAGDLELGQHLNGDEAMALGAAFRGANLSTAFRVRKVGMTDTSSFSVVLKLEDSPEQPEEAGLLGSVLNMLSSEEKKEDEVPVEKWSKHTALFPRRSPVPSKVKTVTFTHDKDITCRLEYDVDEVTSGLLPPSDDKLIALYNISGISKFVNDNAEKGISGTPKVSLSFLLDASGMVSLSKAEISMELPLEPESASTITPEESPVEATADSAAAEATEAVDAEVAPATEENATEKAAAPEVSKKSTKKKAAKKDKDRMLKRALKIAYGYSATTPPQYTPEMVEHSRTRLTHLEAIDRNRRAQEAALNGLEGYMLSVKNRIVEEAEELAKVSSEEERQAVNQLCDDVEEWLYGDGRDATVTLYKEKEREVGNVAEPIFLRYGELTDRPAAVERARKQIEGIRKRMLKWPDTMPQITTNETEKIADLVDKVEQWIDEKEVEQSKKTPFEEAEFLSTDVATRMKPVATMLDRLLKKPKPVPKVCTDDCCT